MDGSHGGGKSGRVNQAGLLAAALAALPFVLVLARTEVTGQIMGTVRARGAKNLGDIVVYIEKVEGQFQSPKTPVLIDQVKRAYVPHVLAVVVGTEIEFLNSDHELHNVHARQNKTQLFNVGIPPQRKARRILKEEGVVTLLCDIHPEMSAYIVVLQNPYLARPDEKGNYAIGNVPPGTYTLRAWHEKLKAQTMEVKVPEGGKVTADFELKP